MPQQFLRDEAIVPLRRADRREVEPERAGTLLIDRRREHDAPRARAPATSRRPQTPAGLRRACRTYRKMMRSGAVILSSRASGRCQGRAHSSSRRRSVNRPARPSSSRADWLACAGLSPSLRLLDRLGHEPTHDCRGPRSLPRTSGGYAPLIFMGIRLPHIRRARREPVQAQRAGRRATSSCCASARSRSA